MQTIYPERNWKRSNDIEPFPKIWHRFRVEDKQARTYKVRIQDMTPDQREEVWEIYLKHFCPDEELNRQVRMIEDPESLASRKLYLNHVMDQNLSLVAVLDDDEDKTEHNIMGYLVLSVMSKQDSPFPKLPGVALAKLCDLFDSLYGDINVFEELNSNYLLQESGLVIKREYRRMGIGLELLKTMERVGKVFDVPAAVINLANRASQTLAAKLGLIVFKELKLNEHKDENGRIIFPVSDTDAVVQFGYFKYF